MSEQNKVPDDSSLARVELEISDRIENRVWNHVKLPIVLLAVGLTCGRLFGGSAALNYIERQVEEKITSQIDKDTGRLRDRLTEDLTDISIQKAQIRADASAAEKQIKVLSDEAQRLKAGTSDLEKLKTQYAGLLSQVQSLRNEVATASTRAYDAQQTSGALGSIVACNETRQAFDYLGFGIWT